MWLNYKKKCILVATKEQFTSLKAGNVAKKEPLYKVVPVAGGRRKGEEEEWEKGKTKVLQSTDAPDWGTFVFPSSRLEMSDTVQWGGGGAGAIFKWENPARPTDTSGHRQRTGFQEALSWLRPLCVVYGTSYLAKCVRERERERGREGGCSHEVLQQVHTYTGWTCAVEVAGQYYI